MENICFFPPLKVFFLRRNLCLSIQEILLALALIGVRSSEFQGGKLRFEAPFCCFCKKISSSQQFLFILCSQEMYFLGDSAVATLLRVKDTKEHIAKNRSFFTRTKVPLTNNCFSMHKIILRKIKYFPKN